MARPSELGYEEAVWPALAAANPVHGLIIRSRGRHLAFNLPSSLLGPFPVFVAGGHVVESRAPGGRDAGERKVVGVAILRVLGRAP